MTAAGRPINRPCGALARFRSFAVRAAELERWTYEVMARDDAAKETLRLGTERLAIADAGHDFLAAWEADLIARESRLAHPANQPPATPPESE